MENLSTLGISDDISALAVNLTLIIAGVIAVMAVFFVTGYYNLTAVELVVFTLVFSWLVVFIRNAGTIRPDVSPQLA